MSVAFDKGHIVRREDVAWGDSYDELRRANGDTFHVTNCSPQVAALNRSNKRGVWGLLENLVLKQAKSERYCLFAGPVLGEDDPLFKGVDDDGDVRVAIPRQFWKMVVARKGDELQTFAFILDQDRVGALSFSKALHDSDQIDAPGGEAVRAEAGVPTS